MGLGVGIMANACMILAYGFTLTFDEIASGGCLISIVNNEKEEEKGVLEVPRAEMARLTRWLSEPTFGN